MSTSCLDNLWVYIYCDASPAWKGVELWAATIEIYDQRRFIRRLLPCIALNLGFMDPHDKHLRILLNLGGGAWRVTQD